MSDPKLQRADGCSVFVSLIIGIILVSSYFMFQQFFDKESEDKTSQMISDQRLEKIAKFNKESNSYELKIDEYHADKNSSLESVMKQITDSYRSKPNKSQ
ncbi:MAG: hypothetical protein HN548_13190 [Opitutae bacterium]|nr:hypothetical protein [Opitutae bacterium]